MDDFSLAAAEAELAWLAQSGAVMAAEFNYAELSTDGRASYDFWHFRAGRAAARRPWLHHTYVFTQFNGTHTYPTEFLLNYHAVDTPSDMRAYIAHVRGFARALGQALDRATAAAERGIRASGSITYTFLI